MGEPEFCDCRLPPVLPYIPVVDEVWDCVGALSRMTLGTVAQSLGAPDPDYCRRCGKLRREAVA